MKMKKIKRYAAGLLAALLLVENTGISRAGLLSATPSDLALSTPSNLTDLATASDMYDDMDELALTLAGNADSSVHIISFEAERPEDLPGYYEQDGDIYLFTDRLGQRQTRVYGRAELMEVGEGQEDKEEAGEVDYALSWEEGWFSCDEDGSPLETVDTDLEYYELAPFIYETAAADGDEKDALSAYVFGRKGCVSETDEKSLKNADQSGFTAYLLEDAEGNERCFFFGSIKNESQVVLDKENAWYELENGIPVALSGYESMPREALAALLASSRYTVDASALPDYADTMSVEDLSDVAKDKAAAATDFDEEAAAEYDSLYENMTKEELVTALEESAQTEEKGFLSVFMGFFRKGAELLENIGLGGGMLFADEAPVKSNGAWSFDAYYMEEDDYYHTEKSGDFSLKYQMEFHASTDLQKGAVKIRIPASLMTSRTGEELTPGEVAVPYGTVESPVESNVTPFNYYYETEEDVQYLVFFNFREIKTGTNAAWQVLYKNISLMEYKDGTSWELLPDVVVDVPDDASAASTHKETCSPTALTGSMDSHVTLLKVNKNAYSLAGRSYLPELYTARQVEVYAGDYADSIDIEKYKYMVWEVTVDLEASQHYDLILSDTMTIGGKTVGECVNVSGAKKQEDGSWLLEENCAEASYSAAFYVLTRIPAGNVTPGTTEVKNEASVTAHPTDGVDADQTKTDSATAVYRQFSYQSTTTVNDSTLTKKPASASVDAWTAVWKAAKAAGEDFGGISFTTVSHRKIYGTTHYEADSSSHSLGDRVDGSYVSAVVTDEGMKARVTDAAGADTSGEWKTLGSDDYYLTAVTVTVTDTGYDPYEDADAPVEEDAGSIDRDIYVYICREGSTDWDLAEKAEFSKTGVSTITLSGEYLEETKPWKVEARHNSIDYSTTTKIDLTAAIRSTSPVFGELVTDGCTAELLDHSTDAYTYHGNSGVSAENKTADATVQLLPVATIGAAKKTAKSFSDAALGRYNIEYTLSAYEGYAVGSRECLEYMKSIENLAKPGRKEAVFYDLLPQGVRFDPSVGLSVGRLKTDEAPASVYAWDTADAKVLVGDDDVVEDYDGTGRMLVRFHVTYTGDDPSWYSQKKNAWMNGYCIRFGAYCEWTDIKLAAACPNIMAYMPVSSDPDELLAPDTAAFKDTGAADNGAEEIYAPLGSNIDNEDSNDEAKRVMYAYVNAFTGFAVASETVVKKVVKADADTYGEYASEAKVVTGKGYTYKVTLTNNSKSVMKDMVIFDRLENARTDRGDASSPAYSADYSFEASDWCGTFKNAGTVFLKERGIAPVIWYNTSREAAISGSAADALPSAVLTAANGWYKASEYTGNVSDVKAVAIDISKKTDGSAFKLNNMESVTFTLSLTAPANIQPATWAYNSPVYFAASEAVDGSTTYATTWGDVARVRLVAGSDVSIEKTCAGEIPDEAKDEEFVYTLNLSGTAYANKSFALYEKTDGVWQQQQGVRATDALGRLYLKDGEKAVFSGVPDASALEVSEEKSLFWQEKETKTEDAVTGAISYAFENTFRYPLYFKKLVQGEADSGAEFKFVLKKDNSPAANTAYVITEKAVAYGGAASFGETLYTGADGSFSLKTGQTACFFADAMETYTIEEDPSSYGAGTDYICQVPCVTGVSGLSAETLSITNFSRWKTLRLTKKIDGDEAAALSQNESFTFRIYAEDDMENPVTGLKWRYAGNTAEHMAGADGAITGAFAGKTIEILYLEAGRKYVIKEDACSDHFVRLADGVTAVTVPKYAQTVSAAITNRWNYRDLVVKKFVTGSSTESFTMKLELLGTDGNYAAVTNKSFLWADGSAGTTDADGKFTIQAGQTATFKNLAAEGTGYRVTETAAGSLHQVYPANGGSAVPAEGSLSSDSLAMFINSDELPMVVQKTWQAADGLTENEKAYAESFIAADETKAAAASASYTLLYTLEVKNSSGEWVVPESGYSYVLSTGQVLEVGKIRPTGTTVDVDMSAGTIGLPNMGQGVSAVVYGGGGVKDGTWQVKETGLYIWDGSKGETVTFAAGETALSRAQSLLRFADSTLPKDNAAFVYMTTEKSEDTADGSDPVAELKNRVGVFFPESRVKKFFRGSVRPTEGAEIAFLVERYNGSSWMPAEDIGYSVVSAAQDAGAESIKTKLSVDDDGYYYTQSTGKTGADGMIYAAFAASEIDCELQLQFDAVVTISPQNPVRGTLRISEVADKTDASWGSLIGYTDENGEVVSDTSSAAGFLNGGEMKELEIAKVMADGSTPEESFSISFALRSGQTEDMNLPYTVYNINGDTEVSSGVASGNTISLLAGQYARLSVPMHTEWVFTEKAAYPYSLLSVTKNEASEASVTEKTGTVSFGTEATFDKGSNIRDAMNTLAGGAASNGSLKNITSVKRARYLPAGASVVSASTSPEKIYMWYEDGAIRWYTDADTVYANQNATQMFCGLEKCQSIDTEELDTSRVTNMTQMFNVCSALASLDISGFDTGNVTSMMQMFSGCSALASLDLSGFDTGEVTTMQSMFGECKKLEKLDLSGFDFANVQSTRSMFYYDNKLKEIIFPENMSTPMLTDTTMMFNMCSGLTNLDVSGITTGKVTSMQSVFSGCSGLTSLDVSNFDTSKAENMMSMFSGCSGLTSLDLSGFTTGSLKDTQTWVNGTWTDVVGIYSMFTNCTKLETIYVSEDWSAAEDPRNQDVFANCTKLKGGAGSTIDTDSAGTGVSAARIDAAGKPGLFTKKN